MTGGPVTRNRAEALAQLAAEHLDVLVIGGGVVGAGVAWPLARAGLRVAVVDARDLAGAPSSASSDGLLLGTTDHPYEGDPADVAPDPGDEHQILAEAALSLTGAAIDPSRIRQRFAGLRVLPVAAGPTSDAPREVVLTTGPGGMVSIAGGKLTTWRRIGLQAAGLAAAGLGRPRPDHRPVPLPSAVEPETAGAALRERFPLVDPAVVAHLVHGHGAAAGVILSRAAADPTLLAPLSGRAPDIAAQVLHARDREWAVTVDDVVRRTGLAPRGADDEAARLRIATLLRRRS